jgi:2-oxoisovalerate dehydrogenase E2 component (dihydrolipoyl transacylase)
VPTFRSFRLPDVGEGLTEADIVDWRVAVGDEVQVNQTIVEIETAKSLVELPSPFAGVVTEILADVGATVDVGTPIIVVDVDPTGEAGADEPGAEPTAAHDTSGDVLVGYGTKHAHGHRRPRKAAPPVPTPAAPAPAAPAPAASAPAASAPAAAAVAPAPAAPASAGQARPAASTSGPAAGIRATSGPAAGVRATSGPAAGLAGGNGGAAAQPERAPSSVAVLAKPPVRKLARDLGVDLSVVTASGPGGIITREDVLAHSAGSQPQVLATYPGDDQPWLAEGYVSGDGRTTRVPVKSVRRRTAEAMVASAFTAPHVTVFHTVDVTRTMSLVQRLREDRAFADVRVTPLLIVAKAFLIAVRRHPEISAAWDDATQEIVYKHYVNLGIAAATPRGLLVPNVKDAHRMTLHELAEAIGELTKKARAGKSTPADLTDGVVTITNVGVFGIDTGTPILVPGESAILAFGSITERPWVYKGKIKKRWVTQLGLSFDHRFVDGELGSRVLADVAALLEDPAQAMVWT